MNVYRFPIASLLLLSFVLNCQAKIHYDNWKLVLISDSESPSHLPHFIKAVETDDKYRIIRLTADGLELAISPQVNEVGLNNHLEENHLKSQLLSTNIERLINDRMRLRHQRSLNDGSFNRYMPWDEMEKYLLNLEESYPNKIRKEILGRSYEGRNIYKFTITSKSNVLYCTSKQNQVPSFNVQIRSKQIPWRQLQLFLKIPLHSSDLSAINREHQQYGFRIRPKRQVNPPILSRINTMSNSTHNFFMLNYQPSDQLNRKKLPSRVVGINQDRKKKIVEKPVIFIDGGSHSREWISPAAVIYLIEHLAQNPSLTEKIQWQIVPMINPDGYVYSWTHDRFWRKTRSNTTLDNCKGVDLNRNFGHRWGKVDTSSFPCAENYGGHKEFSEIETMLLRDSLMKAKKKLKAYLSIHNWGQDILHPYSFSVDKIPRSKDHLKSVGEGMTTRIFEKQGVKYRSGESSILLYPASGTAIDWVYDNLHQPLAYLIELRDKMGLLGFILPEAYIEPTSKDLIAAVSYLALSIEKDYRDCS